MPGSSELYRKGNIFSTQCDVADGRFEPFIRKDESFFIEHPCEKEFRNNIITCKDDRLKAFIDEVDGLSLDTPLKSGVTDLPPYIPIISAGKLPEEPLDSNFPVIGISLSRIIRSGTSFLAGSHRADRIKFGTDFLSSPFFQDKTVIVFLAGPDSYLEQLWHRRSDYDIFEILKSKGISVATGINFSVFKGECPIGQRLNQKKSLVSCSLLEQHDITVIPHVYSVHRYHTAAWIQWFTENSHINYFTINCQIQRRSKKDTADLISVISEILISIPHLKVLLQGFPLSQLHRFGILNGRIHIADSAAWMAAQFKQRFHTKLENGNIIRQSDSNNSVPQVFLLNTKERCNYINNLKELYATENSRAM